VVSELKPPSGSRSGLNYPFVDMPHSKVDKAFGNKKGQEAKTGSLAIELW
jgi:hypothetical protein